MTMGLLTKLFKNEGFKKENKVSIPCLLPLSSLLEVSGPFKHAEGIYKHLISENGI